MKLRFALIVGIIAFGLLPHVILAQTDSITAELAVAPSTVVVNETTFTATIRLRGDTSVCPAIATERPVDAALVLDVSNSMVGEPLAQTQAAARVFVETMALDITPVADTVFNGDQVAVIDFSGTGREIQALSTSSALLNTAIDSLTIDPSGGTNIAGGLQQGIRTVTFPDTRNPNAVRVIVLLSDGEDDNPDAVTAAANSAKTSGVRIVTIGLGAVVDNLAARALLESIATAPADFYEVRTPAELPAIFESIAETIQPMTAGTNIELTYQYDMTNFEVDTNSIFPPASSTTANTITWVYGRINGGEAPEFSFRAQALRQGTFDLGEITSGAYFRCETGETAAITGIGPTVVVQNPTPTPLPSLTPTPRPTNTPLPTPTATAPGAFTGEFIPDTTSSSSIVMALGFCAEGLGSLLPLIFALLIILLLLLPWLIWHWLRLRNRRCSVLCFLAWSIFGLWAAFALWLLSLPLAAASCESRESVYFWRQEGASRLTGIYLTAPNMGSATGFTEMNEGNCVGCHTVSSTSNRVAAIQGSPPNVITVRNFDGSIVRVPPEITNANYLSFSPDGRRLVYADSEADLYIVDLASNTFERLAGASEPGVVETMPSWGPNGQIAFVRAPDLSGAQYAGVFFTRPVDIFTIPETGGVPSPVSGASGDGFNYYPAYSPNGQWIAFTRHNNATTYSDPEAEIYIVPAGGGSPMRLNANNDVNGNPIPGSSNSWATWSMDGTQLAFNSKRSDELYDIYTTTIDETGQSSIAVPLTAAAQRGVFEHTPFWGLPIARIDIVRNMLALWPFLLPLLPLAMLAWVACRKKTEIIIEDEPVEVRPEPPPPIPKPLRLKPLLPPWQPQPTLIIGLGGTGRQILTQLKKTLRDAQLGEMPSNVRLIGLDTGDYEQLYGQTAPIAFADVKLDEGEVIEIKDDLQTVMRNSQFQNDPMLGRGWVTEKNLNPIPPERFQLAKSGANKMRLLARAGLLHHLRTASPNFFNRLSETAPHCVADKQLNVVIVGDTFGDIGSAVLFDIALLARQVGENLNASVAITAHLITAEAIRTFSQNREQDLANTGATLREIERFQLAESRPFPIFYPKETIKKDYCDTMPLDNLFLYDGKGLELEKPEVGIFPTVADAIALWMDKASAQGELRQMQSDQRSAISQQQSVGYEVHVFSQGMFTYRLPFADLLEDIRARFAHEIFRWLVMGRNDINEQLTLNPSFNQEPYLSGGGSPDDVARAFLTGDLSVASDRPAPGFALAAVRALTNSQYKDKLVPSLRKLEPDARDRMLSGLRGALNLLLNGKQETARVDIFRARGGKIGFALAFLQALETRIDRILPTLDAAQDVTDKRDQLKAILDDLKAAAQTARESLQTQAQALGVTDGVKNNLNTLLGKRSFNLQARLTQMGEIKTRTYLSTRRNENGVEQHLADYWYGEYMGDKRGPALGQFYWRVDNDCQTTLLLYGESETPLNPSDVPAFERALIDVAMRYCTDVRNNASLSALLGEEIFATRQQIARAGQMLQEKANALLKYESSDAPQMSLNTILAVNESVNAEALSREIADHLKGKDRLYRMNSTDPYSLSLNQRAAILPFSAVTTLENARDYYRRNHNLLSDPRAAVNPRPIPTAVYEAEAEALRLEAQLVEKLRLRADLLHPLVVTALTMPDRVKVFTLTLAAGEMELRKLKGRDRQFLVMYLDGREVTFPETFEDRAVGSDLHPLAQSLLMFVLDKQTFPNGMIENMLRRFETDTTLPDILKAWIDGAWQEWLDLLDPDKDELSYEVVEDILKVSRLYAEQYRQ